MKQITLFFNVFITSSIVHDVSQAFAMAEAPAKNVKNKRFLSKNEEQKQNTLDGRVAPNTKKATQTWMKCLNDYISEKEIAKSIDDITDDKLPDLLFDFYTEVRSTKNQTYKNTTLRCLRAGINRYIKEKRSINIVEDQRFIKSNEMFKGVQKEGKKIGKGSIKHKEIIESEDMERLRDFFTRYMAPDPAILQKLVMFNIMFYMCRRGRENFAEMTKETFDVSSHYRAQLKVFHNFSP